MVALEWLDAVEKRAVDASSRWRVYPLHGQSDPDSPDLPEPSQTRLALVTDVEFALNALPDILRLCRAVRELRQALRELVEDARQSNADPQNRYVDVRDAEAVLERWERGGDQPAALAARRADDVSTPSPAGGERP